MVRTLSVVSGVLIIITMLMSPQALSFQATGSCSGTFDSGSYLCAGSCPVGGGSTCDTCRATKKSDAIGDYKVCLCCASQAEPGCCHTIVRQDSNGQYTEPDQKGTCNTASGCAGGSCADINNDPDIIDYACPGP